MFWCRVIKSSSSICPKALKSAPDHFAAARSSSLLCRIWRLCRFGGNIDTRINKIETENLTGIVLAAAGIRRLGYVEKVTQFLPTEIMLPAVGQGALGLQVRERDERLAKLCAKLNSASSATEVGAERSYLRALGGGCRLPIAAYAFMEGKRLALEGLVASPDGTNVLRNKVWGDVSEADDMGRRLADLIMEKGGRRLLESL